MTTAALMTVIVLPVVSALIIALLPDRHDGGKRLGGLSIVFTLLTLLAMVYVAATADGSTVTVPVMRLSFWAGGFQKVYGLVVCFMWFVAALLSPQYFDGHHHLKRYYYFFLICLSFTAGVFLSADLYTTFLFFELMSLSSYVWVVQEETPNAMDAGKTYLTIAVLGGLVTLMGLFLLYDATGTLVIAELHSAAADMERGRLWAAGLCILFGFAAKAGLFSLHIWLPKAHPVAPAPASALLSGVLTKAGIFGVLLLTAQVMAGDRSWGMLLLVLGAITMVLGAVMAVFSTNLKYILACSSLSQIGFITVGASMICLLGEHNALAANGTVLYMMNHSLVKLVLFLFAGVVYYNTHALDLNEIKGFGRKKPLLQVLFLCGACSLAGIPGFLGYLSKTLVHEALVEYAHMSGMTLITAVEWLFLFSGGLTAAYLTKIYVAIFRQKGKADGRRWGNPLSVIALCLAAAALPLLGLTPHAIAEKISGATLDFTGGHAFDHAIHYFAWTNLKGVVISLAIGMAVYFLFIRTVLMTKDGRYLSRWPKWLSMEESLYKPFFRALLAVAGVVCRAVCDAFDVAVLLVQRTLLRPSREKTVRSYSPLVRAIARQTGGDDKRTADRLATDRDMFFRMAGSLSFGLLMTCLGLCIVLTVVVLHTF